MKKTRNVIVIFIILVLISTNLCGCIDPYAADRYPTAKEAVEASGEYTITKIHGEKELNGIVCFLADTEHTTISCTLVKNENGYCETDKYERNTKIASYTKGNVIMISYSIKFNKHIIEIYMYNENPIVSDTLQSDSVKIPIADARCTVYFILDRIPSNYKICVDGIWYPLPQSLLEIFDEIPPQ